MIVQRLVFLLQSYVCEPILPNYFLKKKTDFSKNTKNCLNNGQWAEPISTILGAFIAIDGQ